jgi:hypothetical protein
MREGEGERRAQCELRNLSECYREEERRAELNEAESKWGEESEREERAKGKERSTRLVQSLFQRRRQRLVEQ